MVNESIIKVNFKVIHTGSFKRDHILQVTVYLQVYNMERCVFRGQDTYIQISGIFDSDYDEIQTLVSSSFQSFMIYISLSYYIQGQTIKFIYIL